MSTEPPRPWRILVVLGTRPEAIKLFPVIAALRADPRFAPRVCVTGQHREMLDQVLAIAGIVPDRDLALLRPGQSLDDLTASLLVGVGEVLDAERPDWVIVQGDTATAFAAGLAAHHRRIPVAHVEAGLRSGDLHHPWPEEANRRMLATFATLHFAPTEMAAAALRLENIDPGTIHITGNTGIDALHWVLEKIAADPCLTRRLAPLERRCAGKRLITVTCHRRENLGPALGEITAAIRRVAAREDVAVIFPVHLNPDLQAAVHRSLAGLANVVLLAPLDYPHFAALLARSDLVLTDSGGVQEEAPALGKPVLVLRQSTERPEGVAEGTARLVGTDADRIASEVFRLLDDPADYQRMARAHSPFGDGRAAPRIAAILARACLGAAGRG